jgi:glutamate-1-semialdehyde 2,1-aminomutase
MPGGNGLLSKRPELKSANYPEYADRARGCEIIAQNKKYLDFHLMGIGCCTLGYSDTEVNDAVYKCVESGNMTSLNCYEEYELAELLLKTNPNMNMVRFSRLGCDALSQAIRVARAHTGKSKVLYWGYHGWHDWYMTGGYQGYTPCVGGEHIGPNGQLNAGIPKCLKKKICQFELDADLSNIAAVILEPALFTSDFLNAACQQTYNADVPLIYDEITSGFRTHLGGTYLDITRNWDPDIVVYGKAMGNGYPICAIVGNEHVMSAYNDTFVSSTFNTERTGFCAAIATIEKMKKYNVQDTLVRNGQCVKKVWKEAAKNSGLDVKIYGIDPLATFEFDDTTTMHSANYFASLYQQEMVKKGILAGSQYYASIAHDFEKSVKFELAVHEVFQDIAALNVKLESREIKQGVKHT